SRDLDLGRLGLAIDGGKKGGAFEVELGEHLVRGGGDRLEQVDRQPIARDLSEAQLRGAWIDLARHAAAVAGIRDEQDARAALLNLLDEMVEFRAEDPFLRSRRRRLEAGEQENVFQSVRMRSLDPLRLLVPL